MHKTDLQFHHPKTGRRLACEQSATYDHDAFLQVRHLFQRKRIANRSQINHIAEAGSGYGWTHRAAAHRQARLVELNTFAVGKHCQAPIDVELCCYRAKSRLDLVLLVVGLDEALLHQAMLRQAHRL